MSGQTAVGSAQRSRRLQSRAPSLPAARPDPRPSGARFDPVPRPSPCPYSHLHHDPALGRLAAGRDGCWRPQQPCTRFALWLPGILHTACCRCPFALLACSGRRPPAPRGVPTQQPRESPGRLPNDWGGRWRLGLGRGRVGRLVCALIRLLVDPSDRTPPHPRAHRGLVVRRRLPPGTPATPLVGSTRGRRPKPRRRQEKGRTPSPRSEGSKAAGKEGVLVGGRGGVTYLTL